MPRLCRLLLIGLVLLLASACANGARAVPQASTSKATLTAAGASGPSYLWAAAAADASLTGPDDAHLKLVLTGVEPHLTRFTDRPVRDAHLVDMRDFMARWNERFSAVPPNVVLSYGQPGRPTPLAIVVTLSHPGYDEKAGTLAFDAVRIRKQVDDLPGTRFPVKPPVIENPAHTGPVSMFIDSVSSLMVTQVAQLFVAMFQQAPSADALGYFANMMGNGTSWASVAQTLYQAARGQAAYPSSLTNQELIQRFATSLLGRAPEPDAVAYWTAQLDSHGRTVGMVIVDMIMSLLMYEGTHAPDLASQAMFVNRTTIASSIATQLQLTDQDPANTTLVRMVTDDPATLAAAQAEVAKLAGH